MAFSVATPTRSACGTAVSDDSQLMDSYTIMFIVGVIAMCFLAWLSTKPDYEAEVVDTRPAPTITGVDVGTGFGQP